MGHENRTSSSSQISRSSDTTLRGSLEVMPGIRELRLSGGGDKIAVPVDREGHGLIPTESEFGFTELPTEDKDQLHQYAEKHGRDKGDASVQLYSLFPSPKSTQLPQQQLTATELRQSKMNRPKPGQRTSSLNTDPVSRQSFCQYFCNVLKDYGSIPAKPSRFL